MKAVVVGASGGIGAAMADLLEQSGHEVLRFSRSTTPALDVLDEAGIQSAAASAGSGLGLVFDATGFLHDETFAPEKSLSRLDPAHLAHSFAVNAIGPALLMKHFLPLLSREGPATFATLSARVGSISDNQLGGWYSYRAAKAALNQLVRTAAIELARSNPDAVCVALHPGTVTTRLSAPFRGAGHPARPPEEAAKDLLSVIASLSAGSSGKFFDYAGVEIAP